MARPTKAQTVLFIAVLFTAIDSSRTEEESIIEYNCGESIADAAHLADIDCVNSGDNTAGCYYDALLRQYKSCTGSCNLLYPIKLDSHQYRQCSTLCPGHLERFCSGRFTTTTTELPLPKPKLIKQQTMGTGSVKVDLAVGLPVGLVLALASVIIIGVLIWKGIVKLPLRQQKSASSGSTSRSNSPNPADVESQPMMMPTEESSPPLNDTADMTVPEAPLANPVLDAHNPNAREIGSDGETVDELACNGTNLLQFRRTLSNTSEETPITLKPSDGASAIDGITPNNY